MWITNSAEAAESLNELVGSRVTPRAEQLPSGGEWTRRVVKMGSCATVVDRPPKLMEALLKAIKAEAMSAGDLDALGVHSSGPVAEEP